MMGHPEWAFRISKDHSMKITDLRTICLSRMHEPERQWFTAKYRTLKADCAIVVIETDDGIRGIGEATAYGHPLKIREWVDWFKPELIGRDPLDSMVSPRPDGSNRSHDAAVAGIDCALWDIMGKAAGSRVCDLLCKADAWSGDRKAPDRVRLYASAGCTYDWRADPHALIEEADGYISQGLTAMKFRLGTDWSWDGVTVDRFLGLAREISQHVDGRMELMLDGNCRLTEDEALAIAFGIEKLGFRWFEEPVPWSDPGMYARIADAVNIPISGGESFSTLSKYKPFLDNRGYRIVQPDAGLSGITETARIARFAQRKGVPFCPHSWHNGLMMMANAHVVASQLEPQLLERCMIQGPLQFGILAQDPPIENGWLLLPDVPGLGIDIADNLEERFPYVEGTYCVVIDR